MTETLRVESPAKVNLRLEVLKKREDGYHEVRTVLQKIGLSDSLFFSVVKGDRISLETNRPDLPVGRKNLVYRAAELFMETWGRREGVHIRIEKRVPLGAGLGGGSSNAAATLKALNQLFGVGFSRGSLRRMGAAIGADVPFFLFDGDAIGTGIGEKLRPVELPSAWYVLIYPNFEVSTPWAYQHFVLTNPRSRFNLQRLPKNQKGFRALLRNDLEEVVSKKYPEVSSMKEILLSAGALGASMTGSGPTVFGIFSLKRDASGAREKIEKKVRRKGWEVFSAGSIHA